MEEIEVKFKVKNFHEVRGRLKELHARLEWKGFEENFYFDTTSKILQKQKTNLRLRSWKGHSNSLTLKTPASRKVKNTKVRNEYQIELDDILKARKILEKLGFTEYLRYKKYREHWKLQKTSFELDTLRGQHFVEIEGTRHEIYKFAKLFGLDWQNSTTQGYLAILKEMKKVE